MKLALLEIEKNKEKELRNQVDVKIHSHLTRRASQIEQIVEKQKVHEQKVESAQRKKLLSEAVPNPQSQSKLSSNIKHPF